jgi:hypothetical protein
VQNRGVLWDGRGVFDGGRGGSHFVRGVRWLLLLCSNVRFLLSVMFFTGKSDRSIV